MAETDTAILDALLREVNTGEEALQELLASMADDAGLYQDKKDVDAAPQIDRAEELRQQWGVEPGQLWQLGAHRLVCGDCTDAAVVARLMGGEKAQAAVTDPPYNVRDDAWDKFDDFLLFTRQWMVIAKKNAPLIASFFPDKFLPLLPKAAELEGLPFRRSLVWVKPPGSQFAGGQKDGFWFDFEFVQVYGTPAIEPPKSPKFSVFDYRTITGQEHGAEKPAGLYADIWTNYTSIGGIVFEPFSGTGSNLVACEQLGRKCRAVEISPAYVAVAIDRWATATGKTPVLVE
jgi:DNA modification methylase